MNDPILVLDSESGTLEVVEEFFRSESYACATASNSREALEKLCGAPYSLLITELRLPDCDGIDFMRQARALNPDLACIVTAGWMDVDTAIEAMRAGASDFLMKPYHLGALAFCVEKTLERRRLLLENRNYQVALEQRVQEATSRLEQANQELRRTKDYLESLLNSSVDTVLTIDTDFRITYVNRGVRGMLGYEPAELAHVSVAQLLQGGDDEVKHLSERLGRGSIQSYETHLLHKDDRLIPTILSLSMVKDPTGQAVAVLVICKDITQQKQLESELKEMTIKDPLTGMYNQRYLYERLETEIERARRQKHPLSLLLFDVDHFKQYNDTYGHLAGDRVLQVIGEVARECTRDFVDIGFRYGGDEFTLILPEAGEEAARRIAERIRRTFESRRFGNCTLSVGLMTYRPDSTPQSFIRFADEVMYDAKRSGGNRVYVYNPDADRVVLEEQGDPCEDSHKRQQKGSPLKLGICNEIFKEWNDIERTIHYVREVGYDGLEIAPFTLAQYVYDVPAAVRSDIVKHAANAGLEILGIHWVFVGPEGVYLTHPDPEARRNTAEYLAHLVEFCGDIGGKVLVFGSPKQRNVNPNISYNQALGYAREVFEHALPACERHGVTICMEQLTHWETNFCHTVEQTTELIDAIAHPNFQLLLDTKAMTFLQEDRPAVIRKYGKYLRHYHANDANLNGPGWGDVDFGPIFQALRDVNYERYVSVEVFNFEPGPEAIATRSLEYLKRFL